MLAVFGDLNGASLAPVGLTADDDRKPLAVYEPFAVPLTSVRLEYMAIGSCMLTDTMGPRVLAVLRKEPRVLAVFRMEPLVLAVFGDLNGGSLAPVGLVPDRFVPFLVCPC